MQQKLKILNFILALSGIAFAALSAVIWVEPKYPSRVDPRTVQPVARSLESITLDRPVLDRGVVEPIMANNLFREERGEYVPPPPPPPPPTAAAPQPTAPSVANLPAPRVSLRGVFMANGTQVAFLEGDYPVLTANGQIQQKPLKRKGYYLGDPIGHFKIQSISKTQVSLANAQGSAMTVSMPRRSAEQEIQRRGTHYFHKDKDARKNRQVEVEKIIPAPSSPRVQPPQRVQPSSPAGTITPSGSPPAGTLQNQAQAQVQPPPSPRIVSPSPAAAPSRISGASSPAPAPPAAPHISGR